MADELVPTKACKRCLLVLPLTSFQKAPKVKDGREGKCKACKLIEGNEWRRKNAERVRAGNYRRYHTTAQGERSRTKAREYMAAHKEERRVYMVNFFARLGGAEGVVTLDDLTRQHEDQGGRCWWCSEPLGDDATVDHVVPVSRGGQNTPENIVMSCISCNSRKRTRLAYAEWTPPNPLRPEAQA
jgi:5-methylcytosine-specific restriction endonuclease McrA